jgi:hypothetical protein
MIREKAIPHDIVIDLDGPDGNAFVLLGTATDMQSSDYDNLLKVFDKHFGDFVILEKSFN